MCCFDGQSLYLEISGSYKFFDRVSSFVEVSLGDFELYKDLFEFIE